MSRHLSQAFLATLVTSLALRATPLAAQAPQATPPAQSEALRVYLDCSAVYAACDLDFFRTEITFVSYMRDRADAQVLVLMTGLTTGGGGTEFTLTFIGQRGFQGRTDTLRYMSPQTDTPDQIRRGVAHQLRLGLVRYAALTPLAALLEVRYTPPAGAGQVREQRDPWHRWVFEVGLNTYFSGEQSNGYASYTGSFEASRVTEEWKLDFEVYGNQNRNRYEIPLYDSLGAYVGDSTIRTTKESWSADGLAVRSLGPHWSAGLQAVASGSRARNILRRAFVAPAVEWDLFPYAQATRRQFTLLYAVGVESAEYRDTTLYGKISETFGRHSLGGSVQLRQPWGNATVSLTGTQYWNDARNPNLDIWGDVTAQLVRGLSLEVWGGYSFVRSQRFLPALSATPEDVLLQLRQMRTRYEYYGGVGLRYAFGSIYNNVVNPRFRNGVVN